MCGLFGYVGYRGADQLLIRGLQQMEFRGYDSAGVATVAGRLHIRKRAGKIAELAAHLKERPAPGCIGIAHTRWATHGPVTDGNAHPHVSFDGKVAVVHNGFIENHAALKHQVREDGILFRSDTDTEVIAQLLSCHLHDDLLEAVRRVLLLLKGAYGLAVVSPVDPRRIIAVRLGSPLFLGVGAGECFLASDPAALAGLAREVRPLEDGQLCELTAHGWRVFDTWRARGRACAFPPSWETGEADKGGYEHYMLKEIMEQPQSLANTMRGRFDDAEATARLDNLNLGPQRLRQVGRLVLTACGASYHAALVGKSLLEQFARIPVEVAHASEFHHRIAPTDCDTVVIALSQSGETADTLSALREAKRLGHPALSVCNVVGSTLAREADGGIYLHAGPEFGGAGTKSFTSQVLTLALLALHLGRLRHLSSLQGSRMIAELLALPELARRTLRCAPLVRRIAARYADCRHFLYLGRKHLHPVALEGALKLKQIGQIRADCYPAIKGDSLPSVDKQTPAVLLALRGAGFEKVLSDLEGIKARGGEVIAVAAEGDRELAKRADHVIPVPLAPEYLEPLLSVIPLQLLAYHIARLRGCTVDNLSNLAAIIRGE